MGGSRRPDRVIRDCAHPIARHEHGTRGAYAHDACRCDPCTEANNADKRRVTRLKAYGRYDSGMVDASRARQHIAELQALGVGVVRIGRGAGLSKNAIEAIIGGRPSRGEGPRVRIHRETEAAILALPLDAAAFPKLQQVDATGCARRLQALVAVGYSFRSIARHLGITDTSIQHITWGRRAVTAETNAAVKALYERLWDTPPTPTNKHELGSMVRARNLAARNKWAPPLAWDDETIDDPDAKPADAGRKERKLKAGAELVEDIEFLYRTGANPETAAKRVGMKTGSLADALRRQGRLDLSAWVTGWVENPQEFKPLKRKADRAPRQSNAA